MGIRLYQREARTSANGPPSRTPAAGWPRRPGIGRAGARRRLPRGAGRRRAAAGRAPAHAPRVRASRRPTAAAAPTRPRSSRQPRPPHTPSRHRQKPIEPPPTPDPALPPPSLLPTPPAPDPPPPPRRLDGAPTGSHNTHQPTHHTLPLPRCRRPAPGPPAPAWAGPPRFTWRVEEGRPAQRGGLPSSKAQARSEKQARGGAAACSRLRRTPRDEHQETNTPGTNVRSRRLIPGRRWAGRLEARRTNAEGRRRTRESRHRSPLTPRWGRRSSDRARARRVLPARCREANRPHPTGTADRNGR